LYDISATPRTARPAAGTLIQIKPPAVALPDDGAFLTEERMRGTVARLSALTAIALCAGLSASLWAAAEARADERSATFHLGACQGAYPGWVRGVVDGYHDLATSPVENPTSILPRVPLPTAVKRGDQALGFGDGLQAGFSAGVAFGVELGKAARTPQSDSAKMEQATAEFDAYVKKHCGKRPAALDWETTFMNQRQSATVASLNEAHIAMSNAMHANQAAIAADKLARGAQEAEARGDHAAASAFRNAAQLSAKTAADFAEMARSHAATGREEAVQAIIDAEAAADKARKAAESAGG
jgi:hypothetical protein